jgi:hypothetical protein
MISHWLQLLALLSLALAGVCAVWVTFDVWVHPQHMWIMNVVWPITALYGGPLALWAYYKIGRLSAREEMHKAKAQGQEPPGKIKPFWQKVALGATHCGSGCALADMVGETVLLFFPLTLFGMRIFGAWTVDYVLALLFGVFFQYFSIAPMRNLRFGEGMKAAIKADFLSLTAWQLGMYGWMAIVTFAILGHELKPNEAMFWFMMQIAMLAGFCTSFPVNWWLLRAGIKEAM